MPLYRERLLPGPLVFLAFVLLIPAALLVFLPINETLGIICAVVLYAAAVILLILGSPRLEVTDELLIAGRARLPIANVGEVTAFEGAAATAERGPRLDARAWLLIRGWISPIVKVVVEDDRDPVPYWIVSTRRPKELVAALARAKTAA